MTDIFALGTIITVKYISPQTSNINITKQEIIFFFSFIYLYPYLGIGVQPAAIDTAKDWIIPTIIERKITAVNNPNPPPETMRWFFYSYFILNVRCMSIYFLVL